MWSVRAAAAASRRRSHQSVLPSDGAAEALQAVVRSAYRETVGLGSSSSSEIETVDEAACRSAFATNNCNNLNWHFAFRNSWKRKEP